MVEIAGDLPQVRADVLERDTIELIEELVRLYRHSIEAARARHAGKTRAVSISGELCDRRVAHLHELNRLISEDRRTLLQTCTKPDLYQALERPVGGRTPIGRPPRGARVGHEIHLLRIEHRSDDRIGGAGTAVVGQASGLHFADLKSEKRHCGSLIEHAGSSIKREFIS